MMPGYDIQTPLDLLNEGKSGEAIPQLEFLVQHMPSHVTAHVLLAQAYSREERWRESLSAWQNAQFLMPNSPAIRKGLRQVLRILSRQPMPQRETLRPESPPPVEKDAPPPDVDMLALGSAPKPVNIIEEPIEPPPLDEEPVLAEEIAAEPPPLPADIKTVQSSPAKRPILSPLVPPVLATLVENGMGIAADEELDHLIEELESARIVPKPEHEVVPAEVHDSEIGEVASETLARIYEGQKKFEEAAIVYEKLAVLQPEKSRFVYGKGR